MLKKTDRVIVIAEGRSGVVDEIDHELGKVTVTLNKAVRTLGPAPLNEVTTTYERSSTTVTYDRFEVRPANEGEYGAADDRER